MMPEQGVDLLTRALKSGFVGRGPAVPQKVEGSATIDLNVNGIGPNYKAKTTTDGMFKEVRLNRGRSTQMAENWA
jgi:hypothetical protein